MKDPSNFHIPCPIREYQFGKALWRKHQTYAIIVFINLGLRKDEPTFVILLVVNPSLKIPKLVIEDVLVKVDKFMFSSNFIMLDMEEAKKFLLSWVDHSVPLGDH